MAEEKSPLKWKFETGSTVKSPAVVDGVVYFGSNDTHLYAVDIKTGKQKWKFEAGSYVNTSPAVSDGVVYFGSTDNHLYALDAKTGKEKWKFKTGDGVYSSPAVVDGVVYFGSHDNHLYALDAKTGEEKWKFKIGDSVESSPAVVDGVVYFGSYDKHFYAVDAKTGKEKWKFKTGGFVRSSPAVVDGIVYFGSSDNHLYVVAAKKGELKWKFETESIVSSSPAVLDGVVYFGSWDSYYYALDSKTGKEKWKFKTGSDVRSSSAVSDGVVYFGSTDNHLYALDAKTGKEKWKFKTGGRVSSPAVGDGVVYFGSMDSHLYALDIKDLQKDKKERREIADKHGITVEDIRAKYISGEKTIEQAIELEDKELRQKEEKEWNEKEERAKKLTTEELENLTQAEVKDLLNLISIGSELITAISKRTDLDDLNREIVDLKLKLGELRRDNEGSDNYKWLQDALLSITDWGTDIFEALYKDEDVHIRNAVAMNPSLPESILIELSNDSDKRVKLSVLSNSSCPKDLLIKGSEDTENYASSRIRRSIALNVKTPKDIIMQFLKDGYRWVREAAASNKLVEKEEIADLVKNGDRYILKGLLENPNTSEGIKTEITEMLKDEEKFPIETDTYIIENWGCGEYTGGSMTVEEMADEVVEPFEEIKSSGLSREYYEYDDLYHCFGDYDLNENILMPDGTSEKLNLTLETDITDCGADFVMCAASSESGEVGNYEIELEDLFDPTKLTVSEEYGLVEGYEYDGDYFEGESAGESTPGHGYSLPSLDIQVKAGDYYETFYIEDAISEMEENDVGVSDAKAVLKYLKDTYGL